MSTIQRQPTIQSVKQFTCNNCGGTLNIVNRRTKFVTCNYCGSVIDANTETNQIIAKLEEPGQFKPKSFVKLGLTCYFDDVEYMVIGRTRMRSTFKEYWAEDGEAGYSDEAWEYDEWLLLGERYNYFYLIEDKNGFGFSKSYIPKFPNIYPDDYISVESGKIENFDSQAIQRVLELGHAEVVHFEGESTYQIKPGDRVKFLIYNSGKNFTAEWRITENNDIKEIEFFEEYKLSYVNVMKAFQHNKGVKEIDDYFNKLDQVYEDQKRKNSNRKFLRNTILITAAIFILLRFFLPPIGKNQFFSSSISNGSNNEFTILFDTTFKTTYVPFKHIEYISKKPIELNVIDKFCNVSIKAECKPDTSFSSKIFVEFINDKGVTTSNYYDEIYTYPTLLSTDLRIDNTAKYSIKLTEEAGITDISKLKVTITISKGGYYSPFLTVMAVILIIVGLIVSFTIKKIQKPSIT
jgi:hypothetical protein